MINWAAPDAVAGPADIATVLTDRGKPAEAKARLAPPRALRKLNAQRTVRVRGPRPGDQGAVATVVAAEAVRIDG